MVFRRGKGFDLVEVTVDLGPDQLIHQGILVFEMRKEGALGDTGAQDNFFHAQSFVAAFGNDGGGRVHKPGAGLEGALLNCSGHGVSSHDL